MESRRDFIKKAGLIAGGALLPESVYKAMAINPSPGSTVWDADHVVILMQENRSFDHSYGTLKGVRGFNDPRAVRLPNRNKVWLQSNAAKETFIPFRLNIKDTKATWMRDLPHSWENQIKAFNNGRYDNWLAAKPSGNKEYKDIPLTLGYFNREDIPFYYAFADAFTVCDQNFSSSLTGTTPNRLYLWSGTIREKNEFSYKANVKNEDIQYDLNAKWKSYPERLEEHGVAWKIYQNELSLPVGFKGEEESWLANFTDNPIEWFENYQVKFHPEYQQYLKQHVEKLAADIIKQKEAVTEQNKEAQLKLIDKLENQYLKALADIKTYSAENFEKLNSFQKSIHGKAFTTNREHADYHAVTEIEFAPGQKMNVPKGDVLYQFRKDVNEGKLPAVSWVVAPQNFSDHPSAPWYGAWYVSEVLEILTKNPEVWKKTVFILCYDENDGYFDHVPPFVAPHPSKPNTGKVSEGIDLWAEQVNIKHEELRPYKTVTDGPIGLGYRVPLVIASPWSRGGKVSSEIYDHTSILQFLEKFIQQRYKKDIRETNITEWRRTVCGDLSAVFTPYNEQRFDEFVEKESFFKTIRLAKDKAVPQNYRMLNAADIEAVNTAVATISWMPQQEKGIKKAVALPYELNVDIQLNKNMAVVKMQVGKTFSTNGAPFYINAYKGEFESRNYAVKSGDTLTDEFGIKEDGYELAVHGPNGFYRLFKDSQFNNLIAVNLTYPKDKKGIPDGTVAFQIVNNSEKELGMQVEDASYKKGKRKVRLKKGAKETLVVDLSKSYNWYDFVLTIDGYNDFCWQYAGHVETGKESFTDPAMGRML